MKRIGSSFLFLVIFLGQDHLCGQSSMINVYGRRTLDLDGKWAVIIDPYDVGIGDWVAIYKDRKPVGKHDFVEYSFENGQTLNVPGDFNSQMNELNYYESSVWYKRTFDCVINQNERVFIHFGAVNYRADVFFNGKKLGSHEGGFTPFQFELTDLIREKDNALIVRVNNGRLQDGIPGSGFDWFNYGGITRDVHLIKTGKIFIKDYKLALNAKDENLISGYVRLSDALPNQKIEVSIGDLDIKETVLTDNSGYAAISFKRKVQLWTPENPRLYPVSLRIGEDSISDRIGFRTIEARGTQILLNGKPIFLRGVNIHEEIPQRKARAFSDTDARVLINWASELGCNFVRLVHYPHNEFTIKFAEEKGIMVWEEIPVYQNIKFSDTGVERKMDLMLAEMISRDQNRCNVICWSVANETRSSKERDQALIRMAAKARSLDDTRMVTAAFDDVKYEGGRATLVDSVMRYFDVIGVNEYLGWYRPWPKDPGKMEWVSPYNKPMIISEFGGEALYNNEKAVADLASSWSEDYMALIYTDQLKMFKDIPFLQGICPWILADFRSPVRMHPVYQRGWNRKGLLSDQGEKKKAWYIIKTFYDLKKG